MSPDFVNLFRVRNRASLINISPLQVVLTTSSVVHTGFHFLFEQKSSSISGSQSSLQHKDVKIEPP